jgi:uncharacterized protein YqgC (DUF456 family)
MSLTGDAVVALAIAVGLVGIVVPILPGTLLIFAAIAVWAVVEASAAGWIALAVAAAVLAAAQGLKYAVPGRRLRVQGVPARTLAVAALGGVVGFFVIPVVGLVVGFVAAVYLAETARLHDPRRARETTVAALRAVGLSIAIELAGGLAAAAGWATAAIATAG